MTKKPVEETFDHDDCPECGTESQPAEQVPDQSLRYCPKCLHEWFEDTSLPALKKEQTN